MTIFGGYFAYHNLSSGPPQNSCLPHKQNLLNRIPVSPNVTTHYSTELKTIISTAQKFQISLLELTK